MLEQIVTLLEPILELLVAFVGLIEAHPKVVLAVIFITFVVFFPRGTAYRDPQYRKRY
jgi:hypothetical protein